MLLLPPKAAFEGHQLPLEGHQLLLPLVLEFLDGFLLLLQLDLVPVEQLLRAARAVGDGVRRVDGGAGGGVVGHRHNRGLTQRPSPARVFFCGLFRLSTPRVGPSVLFLFRRRPIVVEALRPPSSPQTLTPAETFLLLLFQALEEEGHVEGPLQRLPRYQTGRLTLVEVGGLGVLSRRRRRRGQTRGQRHGPGGRGVREGRRRGRVEAVVEL